MSTNKEQLYNTQFTVLGAVAGDLPYTNGLADLAALPIGSNLDVLTVVSGLPAWTSSATYVSDVFGARGVVNTSGIVSNITVTGSETALVTSPGYPKNMNLLGVGKAYFDIDKPDIGEWIFTTQITDGMGNVIAGETKHISSPFTGTMEMAIEITSKDLTAFPMVSGVLLASEAFTCAVRGIVQSTTSTPGSSWLSYTGSMRFMAQSVSNISF